MVRKQVVATKRFIDRQRDIAKRFMRDYLERIRKYLDDEAFSVRVIQKWTRMKSQDEVRGAYACRRRCLILKRSTGN